MTDSPPDPSRALTPGCGVAPPRNTWVFEVSSCTQLSRSGGGLHSPLLKSAWLTSQPGCTQSDDVEECIKLSKTENHFSRHDHQRHLQQTQAHTHKDTTTRKIGAPLFFFRQHTAQG